MDRLAIFTFLWSGYILFSQITIYYVWFQFSDIDRLAINTLLTLLALASFVRPRSILRFSVLMLAVNFHKWRGMPNMANHGLFTFFVCLTIFVTILKHLLTRRSRILTPEGRDELYREFAGVVRLELVLLYFYVVLHKLNHDYFNPDVSCGVMLYREICERFTFLPTGFIVERMGLIGAIFFEAAIPLLLTLRRTRVAGIFVGMLFHLLLSLHENKFIFDFSAMLYALYFLFLPEAYFLRLREAVAELLQRPIVRGMRGWRGWAMVAAVLMLLVICIVIGAKIMYGRISRKAVIDSLHEILPLVQHGFWFILAAVALAAMTWLVLFERKARRAHDTASRQTDDTFVDPPLRAGVRTPVALILLFVIFNGLCPYIGLKTESSFAMYSNLRTERGSTNHFFMPVRFRVAGYQEDVIEIVESNDRYFASLALEREGITAMEFQKSLNRRKRQNFFVTFKRAGAVRTLTEEDRSRDPLFQPLSWPERRLLHFRVIQLWDGPQLCGH